MASGFGQFELTKDTKELEKDFVYISGIPLGASRHSS